MKCLFAPCFCALLLAGCAAGQASKEASGSSHPAPPASDAPPSSDAPSRKEATVLHDAAKAQAPPEEEPQKKKSSDEEVDAAEVDAAEVDAAEVDAAEAPVADTTLSWVQRLESAERDFAHSMEPDRLSCSGALPRRDAICSIAERLCEKTDFATLEEARQCESAKESCKRARERYRQHCI